MRPHPHGQGTGEPRRETAARPGHIAREIDSADRRRAHLRLTGRGRAVYDDVAPATLEWERELLARLTETEVAILDTVIARLQQVADEMAAGSARGG